MEDLHSKLFTLLPDMSPLNMLFSPDTCHRQEDDSPLQMFLNDMNCHSPNSDLTP